MKNPCRKPARDKLEMCYQYIRKPMVAHFWQKGKDNMPKVTLGANKYESADNCIRMKLKGIVNVEGGGHVHQYVPKRLGLNYGTYAKRMNMPDTFRLTELREIFSRCNFTDEEVLQICGRR